MPPQIRDITASSLRPGLGALIVYLRPAPRARLLRLLAELGIFVVEHQGAAGAVHTAYSTRTDFIIVVAAEDDEHVKVARDLLSALSSVLVVLLPPAAAPDRYVAVGAVVCINEDVPDVEFGRLIAPAVRQARGLRGLGDLAAEFVVCQNILFRTMPPELVRDGRTVALTRVEAELLTELSRARGRPVRMEDLERRVASLSPRSRVRRGYVKTIVLRIRRKVARLGGDPSLLRNVRAVGYMLVALLAV